ncbi:MAG: hypothetical protein EP338_03710 [Bacteroidetes bacterium]|nr:MAG: hypothetical protein EP338_03710 [Bacteroidota bacterium]
MEQLFNTDTIMLNLNFNPVTLETKGLHDLNNDLIVDYSTASIEELCSIVVSDMIDLVKEDLTNISISS